MSSALGVQVLGTKAVAFVDSDAVTPVYFRQRGFAGAITRTGAGDYTLTLGDAVDTASNLIITTGIRNTAGAFLAVELLSSTALRVRAFATTTVPAITATDLDFWIKVEEFGPN